MTVYGTSYFVNKVSAIRYYKGQSGLKSLALAKLVVEKMRGGDIHIGKPPTKAGDKLVLLDGGTRYGIEVRNAT